MKAVCPLPPVEANSWCRTSLPDTVRHSFAWTIENFSQRKEKPGQSLRSSEFSTRKPDGRLTRWRLQLYPRGWSSLPNTVAVYLRQLDETSAEVSYEISIIDFSRQKQATLKQESAWQGPMDEIDADVCNWQIGNFVPVADLLVKADQWLPEDNLTLLCEVSLVGAERRMSSSCPLQGVEDMLAVTRRCQQQLNQQLEDCYRQCSDADSYFLLFGFGISAF